MLLAVANVSLLNSFIENNDNNISLTEFNNFFKKVESYLNEILNKIDKKGTLMKISLLKANNYNDLVKVYNSNISTINDFLLQLDNAFKAATFGEEDLLVTDLKFVNHSMKGTITINKDDILVKWTDPQSKNHSITINNEIGSN